MHSNCSEAFEVLEHRLDLKSLRGDGEIVVRVCLPVVTLTEETSKFTHEINLVSFRAFKGLPNRGPMGLLNSLYFLTILYDPTMSS